MRYLDLTLAEASANIALDEALLETAEASAEPMEILRLWEPTAPIVVLGRSSSIQREVRFEACRDRGVSVIRRSSGGLAVVAGPGCLMYALVLSYDLRPELRQLDVAHREVLATMVAGLSRYVPDVAARGTSDLAIGARKVSGNSVRCKRRRMLYHGTLLYDFPLALIGELLNDPPRAPEYRAGRGHEDFVANMPATREQLREALLSAWNAREPLGEWPQAMVEALVAEKYSRDAWNFRH
jgi:lipoate-protein ligase A